MPTKFKTPQPGDKINYIFQQQSGLLAQQIVPARVLIVHSGNDSRLIEIEVTQQDETLMIGPTPYREPDPKNIQGHTWHWPDDPTPAIATTKPAGSKTQIKN